jgi:hypothetical protein
MTDMTNLENKLEQQLNLSSNKAPDTNKPSKSKKESDKFLLKTAKVNSYLLNVFYMTF